MLVCVYFIHMSESRDWSSDSKTGDRRQRHSCQECQGYQSLHMRFQISDSQSRRRTLWDSLVDGAKLKKQMKSLFKRLFLQLRTQKLKFKRNRSLRGRMRQLRKFKWHDVSGKSNNIQFTRATKKALISLLNILMG